MPYFKPNGTRMSKLEEEIFISKFRIAKYKTKVKQILGMLINKDNTLQTKKRKRAVPYVVSGSQKTKDVVLALMLEIELEVAKFKKPIKEKEPRLIGFLKTTTKEDDKERLNIFTVVINNLGDDIVWINSNHGVMLSKFVEATYGVFGTSYRFKNIEDFEKELTKNFGDDAKKIVDSIEQGRIGSEYIINTDAKHKKTCKIAEDSAKLYNDFIAEIKATKELAQQ